METNIHFEQISTLHDVYGHEISIMLSRTLAICSISFARRDWYDVYFADLCIDR